MTDKLLKRLIRLMKYRTEVEIDTVVQKDIRGNDNLLYKICDKQCVYIVPKHKMYLDITKFNKLNDSLVMNNMTEEDGQIFMDLIGCSTQDRKKVNECIYETITGTVIALDAKNLDIFSKVEEIRYSSLSKCVTLYDKDFEIVGYMKPNWVKEKIRGVE